MSVDLKGEIEQSRFHVSSVHDKNWTAVDFVDDIGQQQFVFVPFGFVTDFLEVFTRHGPVVKTCDNIFRLFFFLADFVGRQQNCQELTRLATGGAATAVCHPTARLFDLHSKDFG